MRIVHEIHGRAQVGGTVDAYTNGKGDAKGGSCDILMVVPGLSIATPEGGAVEGEGEAIFIEGDVDDVIDMLVDALRVIQINVEETGIVLNRAHSGFPIEGEKP